MIIIEYGCLVCNGMASVNEICPHCGEMMEDKGKLENYYGPYSPYEDTDKYLQPLEKGNVSVAPCVHLLSCIQCGYDIRIGFDKVIM